MLEDFYMQFFIKSLVLMLEFISNANFLALIGHEFNEIFEKKKRI